jgi:hypothetical protein
MHKLSRFFLIKRKRDSLVKMTLSLCLLLIMTACVGAGNNSMNKRLSARVLLSSSSCGVMEEGASLSIISSEEELAKGSPRLASLARKALGENFNTVFDREQVIQINMGLKRTGGYSLALTEDGTILEDNWANIGLRWNIPPKGAMLTQVLTSPCLLVAIPKQEYAGIRVVDQTGKIRLQMSL